MSTFQNLVQMQEDSCRRHGDREMFGTRSGDAFQWTRFREFARAVDEFRAGLHSLGVQAGDKVAIIAHNCVEWAVSAYATYGLRAHFVPMYESQSASEWEYILRDCGARVLLVRNPELLAAVADLPDRLPQLRHLVVLQDAAPGYSSYAALRESGRLNPVPSQYAEPEEPFGLIYTSGTTGDPKGVILTHANLLSELSSIDELLDIRPTDRSLSFLPWGHLMGQIEEVHSLVLKGYSTAIVGDVSRIMEDFLLVRPTIFFSVPKMIQRLYDAAHAGIGRSGWWVKEVYRLGRQAALRQRAGRPVPLWDHLILFMSRGFILNRIRSHFGGRLRYVFSGGAALSPDVITFMDDLGIPVYEGYGMTETTMAVTANTGYARRPGSVGKPLGGATVVLDDSQGGEGEGEIVVSGPLIASGYHNKMPLFEACLDDEGGFRTGDLGRFDADGFLYITGRIKELYKLANGKYVAPAPLEESIKQSPVISQALIYGDNRPYNVLLVVPEPEAREGAGNSGDNLHHLIEAEIERYSGEFKSFEKPRKFTLLTDDWSPENGLLTPTLKVRRKAVLEKYMPILEEMYC